jgi:hypothetical protein
MDADKICVMSERDFNLIGGQPFKKYRATTGAITQDFLKTFFRKIDKSVEVTIGVLTANWFIVGTNLDEISICARGIGHMDFKKTVSDNCQHRILVAPLGKILPIQNVETLNEILATVDVEAESYKSYVIPEGQRDTTYLLTTHREQNSRSPFITLTKKINRTKVKKNYTLHNACPNFAPPGGTHNDVFHLETPHEYIRDRFADVYGFDPPIRV